ncbi:MAG TPA: TlpA disulfide reductase family protein [Acidobacteriaceae bacterium]|nr:TlpA disulfide reductase family protein [Acidobacteriaceae bacterium]
MRPNYADIRLTGDYPVRELVLSGVERYQLDDKHTFKRTKAQSNGADADDPWWGLPYRFFFTQNTNPFGSVPDPNATLKSIRLADGQESVERHGTAPMDYTAKLLFDKQGVLVRSEVDFGDPAKGGGVFMAELQNVKVNEPMKASSFAFVPPPGAVADVADPTEALLALGAKVKDFSLPLAGGSSVRSASARRSGKTLLLNFWYLNCPPCRLEFPELEKMYERFHGQGLEMVAIDKGDGAQPVQAYAKKTGLTMPLALGGPQIKGSVFDDYKVEAFPVSYLVDPEGKVIFRSATGDVTGLQQKLAELGFK